MGLVSNPVAISEIDPSFSIYPFYLIRCRELELDCPRTAITSYRI